MSIKSVRDWFNPEETLGGFARNDNRVVVFTRVNALLRPDMTVLDFGAGRGKWAKIESGYKAALTSLRGKCAKLIGADVDPAVKENAMVDESVVIDANGDIPLPDASVDMVISWAVLEHVGDAEKASSELARVLKPGGYLCAWTPNKWSYFAIAARLVPNNMHYGIVSRLQKPGMREEKDVFPTRYRMNTLGALSRLFPPSQFENYSYRFNGPPAYHGGMLPLAMLWSFWAWLMPNYFAQSIHVFLRKRES